MSILHCVHQGCLVLFCHRYYLGMIKCWTPLILVNASFTGWLLARIRCFRYCQHSDSWTFLVSSHCYKELVPLSELLQIEARSTEIELPCGLWIHGGLGSSQPSNRSSYISWILCCWIGARITASSWPPLWAAHFASAPACTSRAAGRFRASYLQSLPGFGRGALRAGRRGSGSCSLEGLSRK